MRLRYFPFLLILLFLAGCVTVPQPEPNTGPVLESFKINEREVTSGYGPIIGQSGQLVLLAKASSSSNLSSLSIERKKHGENNVLLTTCVASPCEFDWDISKADNGVYSFFVTIIDSEGVTLKVPFTDSLSIDIENAEPAAETILNF